MKKFSKKSGVAALVILPFVAAASQAYATSAVAPNFATFSDTTLAQTIAGFPVIQDSFLVAGHKIKSAKSAKSAKSCKTGKISVITIKKKGPKVKCKKP